MKMKGWFFKAISVCIFFITTISYAATPWLHVDANQIKDPVDNVVVLRGVDMMDLGQTEAIYGGALNMIDRITNKSDSQGSSIGWHPKIIRIMITPPDAASNWHYPFNKDNNDLYNLLRTTVDYCKTKDLYAIIDWHYVANTYDHRTTTSEFWNYMAPRFANDSHVIFELFNEPINDVDNDYIFNANDSRDWASVKSDMQTWINIVRTYAPNNLIFVAGPYYSQVIGPITANPLTGYNIVIVSHIYPSHWLSSSLASYKANIESALTQYPVIMTEWGFSMSSSDTGLQGTITNFGQPVMDYREARGISNSAWVASYDWGPPMFYNDWSLRVGENEMGGFVKDKLYLKKDANQPVDPCDTTAPATPTGLTATPIPGRVTLHWNTNTETDLLCYDIFRSDMPGTGYGRINTNRSRHPDLIDFTVANNTTYYYKITALDTSYNQSNATNEISVYVPADVAPPARPMALTAVAGDGVVSLNWGDNYETDLAGYNVYRSTASGQGYVKLNDTLLSDSAYMDNTVFNGLTYYYIVTAVDTSSNESQYSDERTAAPHIIMDVNIIGSWGTMLTHAKEPGTDRALIFIVHAEYANTGVSFNSISYGGRPMTKIIDRFLAGSSNGVYAAAFILNDANIDAADNSGSFSANWTGVPTGYAYSHAFFKNVNQANPVWASSSGSSTSNPTTTAGLSTNYGDMVIFGAACSSVGTFTINNNFNSVPEYAMTNSDGVDGYKRATGVTETPSVTHSASNSPRKVIIGFVLKSAPVPDFPPAVPVNLSAIGGVGMVTLDWNDNGETDLAGYNIYRSATSGSGYTKLNETLLIDSNYIDTAVTNNTPYFYVVTAVDAGSNESGYSNEASATPYDLYNNCAAVQTGGYGYLADLDHNCYVDYGDLAILADYWLNTDCASIADCQGADITPADGVVDFLDLNNFASQWMQCNDPDNPDCLVEFF